MPYDPNSDDTQLVSRSEWKGLLQALTGVCENCGGTGVVTGPFPIVPADCPLCGGSGEQKAAPSRELQSAIARVDSLSSALLAEKNFPPIASPTTLSTEDSIGAPLFLSDEEIAQLDQASNWHPSPDQDTGLQTLLFSLLSPGAYVLDGCAGTGKTTLVKALLRRLSPEWEVILIAPTWRAANRLREVTGQAATSIHRVVYGAPLQKRRCTCGEWSNDLMKPKQVRFLLDGEELKPVEEGTNPPGSFELSRYVCPACKALHEDATRFPQRLDFNLAEAGGQAPKRYRLVVVDEVGMVPPKVRRDLRKTFEDERTRVLGVGDQNQLSWVMEGGAEEEDEPYLSLKNPTVSLTQVHRQMEGDPALRLAQDLKVHPEMSGVKWPFPFKVPGVLIESKVPALTPARWAASLRHAGRDLALIAFSNKTRAELNQLVRQETGALAYAASTGAHLIPGDRLLARANTPAREVFNGELFDLCGVWPVEFALLNDEGRIQRKRPTYEHDRILEGGAAVFHVELARVGDAEHRRFLALIVAPRRGGHPLLETDLILSGMMPSDARQRAREFARAWREEYAAGIEERQAEFEMRRAQAESKRIAEARFLRAQDQRGMQVALRTLRRLPVDEKLVDEVERDVAADLFTGAESREGVFARFAVPHDAAIECANAQEYCARVYGAVDPARVCTFDFGEALTCHAMQGSQAEHVGVIFDGPFWGAWKNDRVGALRWSYTALTRSAGNLALFSVRREG